VGEFEKFVRASGYKTETEQENGSDSWRNPGFAQTSDHPVIRVSWNDAMVYIEWLSDQTDAVYRLMTEAQWEYAARAGTTTPFHFGSTISTDQANYNGNYIYGDGKKGVYRKQTAPVGQFPANHWGLHDTHGNVWEWTASEYEEDYSGKEGLIVSKNNAESVRVVVRGGSWDDWPARVRSARRGDLAPRGRVDNQGFRLARPL
jgi:formylglycine-generating enzyme required for sulfatase activity